MRYFRMLRNSGNCDDVDDYTLYSDDQLNDEKELMTRNHYYTLLLNSYVRQYIKNQDKKNIKKWQFYNFVVIAFIVFLLLLIVMSIIVTIFYNDNERTVITSYLSTFIGAFVSLAVIPHTIVKYLFNPEEDEIITKMVIEMQKQDNHNKEINRSKGGIVNDRSDQATSDNDNK
ncbi:YrzE family protein [bacterium]|nr:YrzE family protein [bacterium]